MPTLCEFQHHHFCCTIPFAVWFVIECPVPLILVALTEEKAVTYRKLSGIFTKNREEFSTPRLPLSFVVRSTSLYIDMKMMAVLEILLVDLKFVRHQFVGLLGEAAASPCTNGSPSRLHDTLELRRNTQFCLVPNFC